MESKNNLSKNIRAIRCVQKKSLACFSEEVGIAKSTLFNVEKGRGATLDTLDCLAEHLHVPVNVLLSNAAAPKELGVFLEIARHLEFFTKIRAADQEVIVDCMVQVSRTLAKYDFFGMEETR